MEGGTDDIGVKIADEEVFTRARSEVACWVA